MLAKENGFINVLQATDRTTVLQTKSIAREHRLAAEGYGVPRQTVWATIKRYKDHGTLCRLPGSGRRFKLTPEVLALIKERMQADDETTATQLVKMVNAAGYKVSKSTIIRARRILGWTFQRLQRLQLDRNDRTRRIITIPCARKRQQV